jgi:hypothetical protein
MFPFEQDGLLPALDRDAADVITGSENILCEGQNGQAKSCLRISARGGRSTELKTG